MFNYNLHTLSTKAGIVTCLLCFWIILTPRCVQANTEAYQKEAFKALLNLDYNKAQSILEKQNIKQAKDYYLLSLINTTALMLEQDKSAVNSFFTRSNENLKALKSADDQISLSVKAEIEFHQAIVYTLNEQEFYAAIAFRQSYSSVKSYQQKYPDSKALSKLSGIQQIMLGSIPERYDWILNFLGMKGDINLGLELLNEASTLDSINHTEAIIWKSLLQAYVLRETEEAFIKLFELNERNTSKLGNLLAGVVAIKDADSKKAIKLLSDDSLPAVGSYHLAEAYLHKGDYVLAIENYKKYLSQTKSEQLIKDAYFKTGMCFLFLNQSSEANRHFELARKLGKTNTEADKYADKVLNSNEPINIKIQQARYYTDGGFYHEAQRVLMNIDAKDLNSKKDKIEYSYRLARVTHKQNKLNLAKTYYLQTIELNEIEPWYFAPNAALQLGYILEEEGDYTQALMYYQKALSYKKHEYKNSIDSKARTAIAQLKSAR